jgi:hypothetical protein
LKQHDFGLDHRDELDEVFVRNAFVHIERMNETGYWIGIDSPGRPHLMINTGVHGGKWFFNVEEDKIGGKYFNVERPRRKPRATRLGFGFQESPPEERDGR